MLQKISLFEYFIARFYSDINEVSIKELSLTSVFNNLLLSCVIGNASKIDEAVNIFIVFNSFTTFPNSAVEYEIYKSLYTNDKCLSILEYDNNARNLKFKKGVVPKTLRLFLYQVEKEYKTETDILKQGVSKLHSGEYSTYETIVKGASQNDYVPFIDIDTQIYIDMTHSFTYWKDLTSVIKYQMYYLIGFKSIQEFLMKNNLVGNVSKYMFNDKHLNVFLNELNEHSRTEYRSNSNGSVAYSIKE